MNRALSILVILFLLGLNASAQKMEESTDSLCQDVNPLIEEIAFNVDKIAYRLNGINKNSGRYKMYLTENIYNLLKLDTATGIIQQVQWSLKDSEEMTVNINSSVLSYDMKVGTFELYPTKNMYQFILLDTTNGKTWHVQWGTESKKRWIHRIY